MAAFRRNTSELNPDDVRMTLGEHLEELRTRVVRALVGLFVGAAVCYAFIGHIMAFLTWPLFEVLSKEGYAPELNYMNVPEVFFTELKIAIIVGLILSAPYSITQIWGFIAAGLYPHERKWVRRFAPVSIALFFIGAAFLLIVVSPLLVRFLVTYRKDLPDVSKYFPLPTALVPQGVDAIDPQSIDPALDAEAWPRIPAFQKDPADAPDSGIWANLESRELRARYGDTIYSIGQIRKAGRFNRLNPSIRLGEYVTFILHLSAAFGIGFQVPVVVAFLAAIGIATSQEMGKLRRYVWFGMAIGAAVITPPDVTSMMFLLLPMMVLYEVGLLAAKFIQQEQENTR